MRIALSTPIVGKTSAVYSPNNRQKNNINNFFQSNDRVAFTAKRPTKFSIESLFFLRRIRQAEKKFFKPYPKLNSLEAAKSKFPGLKNAKELIIKTKDNHELTCWEISPKDNKSYVVFCHGLGINLTRSGGFMEFLADNGFGVLGVELRGYAGQKGISSQENHLKDIKAAYRYLRNKGVPKDQINIFGHSLGGAIAVDLNATVGKVRKLVVSNSLASTQFLAKAILTNKSDKVALSAAFIKMLKRFPSKWFPFINKYDSEASVKKIQNPILFIHSKEDNLIPFVNSKRLNASARQVNPDAKLVLVKAGKHLDIADQKEKILEFLNS